MKGHINSWICLSLTAFILFSCEGNHDDANKFRDSLVCGDLLQIHARKPEYAEYLNCIEGKGQVLQKARYRVKGIHGKSVEQFLVHTYNTAPLKFQCCGWEAAKGRHGSFKKAVTVNDRGSISYIHFQISMHSQETLVKDRKQWGKIPFFYIEAKIIEI